MTEISSSSPMSLDVLELINDSRQTYGLRHQDYLRYREYCANRVRRLRQILKLSQPNKKDNVMKPLPETFQDNRYLQLYVFETERAWAYSMELKQESANSMETRQRHHLIKRLRRASQFSQKLVEICETQTVDSKTMFDVKAYAVLMKGYFFFERQQWKEALDQLIEARTIYEKFAQYNSNAQQEALYYAAMDEIDPNVRFCAYRLQMETHDAENIAKTHPGAHALAQDVMTQMGHDQEAKENTIHWRGQELKVKNQELFLAIKKAQQDNAWTESEKIVKKTLKDAKEATAKVSSSRSEKTVNDLELLFTMVEYAIFIGTIGRALQAVESAKGKHQQIIGLYDEVLKNVEYIRELPLVKDDIQFEGELSVMTLYYRGLRSVEIGLVYSEMDKVAESLGLYERAQVYTVQAKQGLGELNGYSEDAVIKVTEQEVKELEDVIRAGRWKSRAAWHLENEGESMTEQMKELKLSNEYLIDRLESYPGHIEQLVQFPPEFQPISCKPFYFDLAANHIKYPEQSLNERTEKPSGSGIWGIFGKGW